MCKSLDGLAKYEKPPADGGDGNGDNDDDVDAVRAAAQPPAAAAATIEQLVQCIGGFGTAVGAGASCHLLAAKSRIFGGDGDADDGAVDEALVVAVVVALPLCWLPGGEKPRAIFCA